MSEMHVCFATDGKGFQTRLLLTALDSIRRSAVSPSDYFIHILCDTGGKYALDDNLVRHLDAFFPKAGFGGYEYVDVGKWMRDNFPCLYKDGKFNSIYSHPAWFRFSAPFVIDAGRVAYFDTDSVFLRDLSGLFSEDLNGASVGCVVDFALELVPDVRSSMIRRGFCHPPRDDVPYIGDSLILFDTEKFVSSGMIDRIVRAYPSLPSSRRHDASLFQFVVRPEDLCELPMKYHVPLGIASSLPGAQWMRDLERQVWNERGSSYCNFAAFMSDCVSVQLQGPKDTRYFDDPVLGPVLDERWTGVRRFCFPDLVDAQHDAGAKANPGPVRSGVSSVRLPDVLRDGPVECARRLSELVSRYDDWREPYCLLAKTICENGSGSPAAISAIVRRGLSVTSRKPGFPVDDWCWDGGPERLLSSLEGQCSINGSTYIVL